MDQQFSLSWNNFHGNLSKGFAGLLGNGEFVDVTIAVEGHLLQAHKVILSICSPYFKKMFQLNPCQHPIVVLRDVSHKAMRDLLQFMYHGEVSVKKEELTSFIGTAEVLQIKGLTNKETDDDSCESEKEPKTKFNSDNLSPDGESCTPDNYDSSPPKETQESLDIGLFRQKKFIDKLQQLSSLKRKSEDFLNKNYYTTVSNTEKRFKYNENSISTQNNSLQNLYENFKTLYDESPVDISRTLNPNQSPSMNESERLQNTSEHSIEPKTECDESDIVVSDPAVCTTPESRADIKTKSMMPLDLQTTQDSALSLVINGNENQLPVRYKYIYSRKGHKQLVHRNFVYTKHSTSHGKTSWRCVQYFSLNRCPATVETIDSMIYSVNHQHNHENCFDKLAKNNIYEMENTDN
ncbi:broad-complex core protein isoforms 1/2/3/4/5-like isoform X2 [Leptidea sinapis]|uniref:broad-complex core protein isoforms 1/2/3/4/5-like isoform X2 n=1 Tax=Leptidea sinapis TaxID=189913 RepID=UPI0021C327B4|nr:broad-complex core protein isoforms 1/2/3/4/5-like isoform X2 [Leptidea sinapis]